MMLGGKHHILRASVMEYLSPGGGIPVLDLAVKNGSEIVVIIVGAVMFPMVRLGRRPIDSQDVQIPLRIGIVLDVVLCGEVVSGMNERCPARNGVETPMNENPELCVGIPIRNGMPI